MVNNYYSQFSDKFKMQQESRMHPLYTKKLSPDDLHKTRKKYIENSSLSLQKKIKEVPINYKIASLILKCMKSYKLNLHEAMDKVALVEPLKDNDKEVENLVRIILDHEQEINFLIKKVKILEDNLDLDPFLMKIAIGELLWGKMFVKFNTMETVYLRYYESDIKEAFVETALVFDSAHDSYISNLPVYVRINTLAIPLQESINAFYEEGWNILPRSSTYRDYLNDVRHLRKNECIRDFHISELLVFPPGTSFYEHPGYLEGKLFIQDKGSCLATFLLNPKPGSCVLDMFAAPGFTTNHIANMMKNEGMIYACDHNPDRFNRLCSLMELSNVTCVKALLDGCFSLEINGLNYILLDVPSSYSGIFHKKEEAGLGNVLRFYRHKSSIMLIHALQNFPNVKRVVYTACSQFAEEGEKVIAIALKEIDGDCYTLLDVRQMLWNEWITVGDTDKYPFADKCLRIKSETDLCQSYFIAVFERNFSVPVPPCKKVHIKQVSHFSTVVPKNNEPVKPSIPKVSAGVATKSKKSRSKKSRIKQAKINAALLTASLNPSCTKIPNLPS